MKKHFIRFLCFIATLPLLLTASFNTVLAVSCPSGMSSQDCAAIQGTWENWVPDDGSTISCGTSTTSVSGESDVTANQSLDFAREPITSTWSISDDSIEQWFLKQASAQPVIAKYGLTSSNIGEITSVVKTAGVSPTLFYLYTVNEGGGAGGFINHYGSDASGGGPANAQRDAEYLASHSKNMNSQPSWVDAGNPIDFVPQDVKDEGNTNFKSVPSGTIGRVYIPATAAATWEVYYPNGLSKAFNKVQNYGAPLAAAMNNITRIGGDPTQGSAAGCAMGVTGEGMVKGISWAVMIANNDGYGYDQNTRTSGWEKWQADPSCTSQCGSLDCSSFISAVITVAGYTDTNPNFATGGEAAYLEKIGFSEVATSAVTSTNLQAGDILLANGHTALYIGNNQIVDAKMNENGGINGGRAGDQTGKEITVEPFKNTPTWIGVFRAPN